MLGLFIVIYTISLILNTIIYKKKLNFVNVSISIWFIFSILSMINIYDMFLPETITYRYILTYLISFQIFCMVFYKLKYHIKIKGTDNEKINWKFINIIMIICVIMMLYLTYEGLKTFLETKSFSSVRNTYLNQELINNKTQMFFSIGIIPLGTAIGLYSIINYIETKRINLGVILYVIFLAEVLIATGGRNKIVFFAIFIVIALFDKYENNILRIIKKNKKIIGILTVIFLIILAVTLQRNLSGGGFLYNIYAYFAGSIHLLGVYLKNPDTYLLSQDNYLYGQVLISGFFYPISFIIRLFGGNVKAGIYIINETTQIFTPISRNAMINNNVTCLYSALRDFGELGLIIYPCIISLILVNLHKKKEKNKNLYYKVIYYYFLINVIFLIFDFNLSNPTTVFVFIYFWIIDKLSIKNNYERI